MASTTPLPVGQIGAYADFAGFKGDARTTAVAIALAESAGNPWAHNTEPPDDSYGLWQINMFGGLGPDRRKRFGLATNNDLYDPLINAKAAYELSGGGKNFRPWTTYTSGAYKKYLAQAAAVAPKSAGLNTIPDAVGAAGRKLWDGVAGEWARLAVTAVAVTGGMAMIVLGGYRLVATPVRNAAAIALAPETGGASLAARKAGA